MTTNDKNGLVIQVLYSGSKINQLTIPKFNLGYNTLSSYPSIFSSIFIGNTLESNNDFKLFTSKIVDNGEILYILLQNSNFIFVYSIKSMYNMVISYYKIYLVNSDIKLLTSFNTSRYNIIDLKYHWDNLDTKGQFIYYKGIIGYTNFNSNVGEGGLNYDIMQNI